GDRWAAFGIIEKPVDPGFGEDLRLSVKIAFEVIKTAGTVLGDDVHRQEPLSPTLDDQVLRRVEVTLPETVLLEDVAPAPGADLKINCRPYFQDTIAEPQHGRVVCDPRRSFRSASW